MNSCWIHGKTMSHYIYSTNSCEQCQAKMFLVRWRTTRRLYQTWISLHDPCFPYYYRFSTMGRLNFTAWNAIYQQLSNGIKLSRFHQVQSQHTHTHTLWELIISIELLEWLFQSLLDVCHFPTDAEPTELRWARTQTREWKSHLHLVHMSVQSTDLAVPIPWILYISLSLWISM